MDCPRCHSESTSCIHPISNPERTNWKCEDCRYTWAVYDEIFIDREIEEPTRYATYVW